VKSVKANGVRLSTKEVKSAKFELAKGGSGARGGARNSAGSGARRNTRDKK
jgi:hypothetical protein